MCVCVGRRLAGVKQPRIYQLPRWRPESGTGQIPHTDVLASNISPSHHLCAFLFGRLVCHCFHPFILRALFVFLDSKHNSPPLLSFTVFPFPSPLFHSTLNASHPPVIFLLLHLCHWRSRGSTDAWQRGRWESGRHPG